MKLVLFHNTLKNISMQLQPVMFKSFLLFKFTLSGISYILHSKMTKNKWIQTKQIENAKAVKHLILTMKLKKSVVIYSFLQCRLRVCSVHWRRETIIFPQQWNTESHKSQTAAVTNLLTSLSS